MILQTGCAEDTSAGDDQIFGYVNIARDIMSDTAGGIDEANYNAQNAAAIFASACSRAESFTESLSRPTTAYDFDLWNKYSNSFFATLLPCHMYVALVDSSISDYGMFVGQYLSAERCLSTGKCDEANRRPVSNW